MSEIFRHVRPHWYDYKSHRLIPQVRGGISFLLRPSAERTYDFWIYICPEDIEFSSKQAVKSLRDSAARGTVPFGHVVLTDEPIVDVLTRFVINEEMALPSDASKQLLSITTINDYASKKLKQSEQRARESKNAYSD